MDPAGLEIVVEDMGPASFGRDFDHLRVLAGDVGPRISGTPSAMPRLMGSWHFVNDRMVDLATLAAVLNFDHLRLAVLQQLASHIGG